MEPIASGEGDRIMAGPFAAKADQVVGDLIADLIREGCSAEDAVMAVYCAIAHRRQTLEVILSGAAHARRNYF
jgi:hypothetical protein